MSNDVLNKYYNEQLGQLQSQHSMKCLDTKGLPIPWMTYSAIFQLQQYDLSAARIFEWGSGYSSLFWSGRSKHLDTVEHDEEWASFVRAKSRPNLNSILVTLDSYADAIVETGSTYDLIVIDGYIHENMRYKCAELAIDRLCESGVIVLDNSDWLNNTCKFLREQGFDQYDFSGPGPINNYPWCTSLFNKGGVKFDRLNLESPGFVPGGIENIRD